MPLAMVFAQIFAGNVMGKKLVPVNEKGYVIGEAHHRAKLTDHEVDLVVALLESGMTQRLVAEKMEISRRHVRDIWAGKRRGQVPADWKRARKSENAG